MENYSPVVDLRSTITTPFPNSLGTTSKNFDTNTNITYTGSGIRSRFYFTVLNSSVVNMTFSSNTYATSPQGSKGIWTTTNTVGQMIFSGNGQFNVVGDYSGSQDGIALLSPNNASDVKISIETYFTFQAKNNLERFVNIHGGEYGEGATYFNSPYISIDMTTATHNREKYIYYNDKYEWSNSGAHVYFNANLRACHTK